MGDSTTLGDSWLETAGDNAASPEAKALVIAWTVGDPSRMGEVAFFSPRVREQVLGRGLERDDDLAPRVGFFRQRPGSLVATPPLDCPGISRQQLRFAREADALTFSRASSAGRCAAV